MARKLAVLLHRIWSTQGSYVPSHAEAGLRIVHVHVLRPPIRPDCLLADLFVAYQFH